MIPFVLALLIERCVPEPPAPPDAKLTCALAPDETAILCRDRTVPPPIYYQCDGQGAGIDGPHIWIARPEDAQ